MQNPKVLVIISNNSLKVFLLVDTTSESVIIVWYELWKKCLFSTSTQKVSLLFVINCEKKITIV